MEVKKEVYIKAHRRVSEKLREIGKIVESEQIKEAPPEHEDNEAGIVDLSAHDGRPQLTGDDKVRPDIIPWLEEKLKGAEGKYVTIRFRQYKKEE